MFRWVTNIPTTYHIKFPLHKKLQKLSHTCRFKEGDPSKHEGMFQMGQKLEDVTQVLPECLVCLWDLPSLEGVS